MGFQIVLHAAADSRVSPALVSAELPPCLLPVGGAPLIQHTLEWVAQAGFAQALVAASAEVAPAVARWATNEYRGPVALTIVAVPEEEGACGALRHVQPHITGTNVVLISAELVCDLPLGLLLARHRQAKPVATVLLAPRRASVALEVKPGHVVKGAQYVGLDAARSQLCFISDGVDSKQMLRLPRSTMLLTTALVDGGVYLLHRSVLDILEAAPHFRSVRGDLLRYLVAQQFTRTPYLSGATPPTPGGDVDDGAAAAPERRSIAEAPGGAALGGDATVETQQRPLGTNAPGPAEDVLRLVAVLVAPASAYVTRVTDFRVYLEANREIAAVGEAAHLNGLAVNAKHENFVHRSAEIGARSAVGAGCIVGEETKIAEKCSVKRSVLGRRCRVGAATKIVNSVLHDDVVIEEGVQVQGSVVGRGAVLQAGASVRDSQVGAGVVVPAGEELRGEALAPGGRGRSSA